MRKVTSILVSLGLVLPFFVSFAADSTKSLRNQCDAAFKVAKSEYNAYLKKAAQDYSAALKKARSDYKLSDKGKNAKKVLLDAQKNTKQTLTAAKQSALKEYKLAQAVHKECVAGKPNPVQFQPNPVPPGESPKPTDGTIPTLPSRQNFIIEADDSSANLTTINVSKGTTVGITFKVKSTGVYFGGLDFRSDKVSTGTIQAGGSKTIEFVADSSTEFVPYWPASNQRKGYSIKVTAN